MVCKLTRPDPQVLFNRLRDMFSVNVLGGAPVVPESNEHYVVSNDYAAAEMYYAFADQMLQELDPENACCDTLFAMGARDGVYPRPATFAEGYVKLTGTPGAGLPSRIEIVATNGGNFVSVGTLPTALNSAGSAVIRVRALVPGAAQNSAGETTEGSLVTSIAGVNRTVEICGGSFCGGREAETCDEFRTRYLQRRAYQPRQTAAYIQQLVVDNWPCATRVIPRAGSCCRCGDVGSGCEDDANCGCTDCTGNLVFYVLFDGAFPCGIAPPNVMQDLRSWLFGEKQGYGEGQVEMGVCGDVVSPVAVPVNIFIDIVGCITISEKKQAEANIRDLFTTIGPSQTITELQMQVAVANAVGADKNLFVRVEPVNESDRIYLGQQECGDIEVQCDRLPCISSVTFTNPDGDTGTQC